LVFLSFVDSYFILILCSHIYFHRQYFKGMNTLATDGLTFSGKVCLVTGAGKDSIGLELVKGLIGGGARVIVTTSRFGRAAADMYRDVYQRLGGKHSELILYPFNQV
jgi:fatty acid synthase subunit alpha